MLQTSTATTVLHPRHQCLAVNRENLRVVEDMLAHEGIEGLVAVGQRVDVQAFQITHDVQADHLHGGRESLGDGFDSMRRDSKIDEGGNTLAEFLSLIHISEPTRPY